MGKIKDNINAFIEKHKTPTNPQIAELEKDYVEIEKLIDGNYFTLDRKAVSLKLIVFMEKWKGEKVYLDQIRNGRTNRIMRAII